MVDWHKMTTMIEDHWFSHGWKDINSNNNKSFKKCVKSKLNFMPSSSYYHCLKCSIKVGEERVKWYFSKNISVKCITYIENGILERKKTFILNFKPVIYGYKVLCWSLLLSCVMST